MLNIPASRENCRACPQHRVKDRRFGVIPRRLSAYVRMIHTVNNMERPQAPRGFVAGWRAAKAAPRLWSLGFAVRSARHVKVRLTATCFPILGIPRNRAETWMRRFSISLNSVDISWKSLHSPHCRGANEATQATNITHFLKDWYFPMNGEVATGIFTLRTMIAAAIAIWAATFWFVHGPMVFAYLAMHAATTGVFLTAIYFADRARHNVPTLQTLRVNSQSSFESQAPAKRAVAS